MLDNASQAEVAKDSRALCLPRQLSHRDLDSTKFPVRTCPLMLHSQRSSVILLTVPSLYGTEVQKQSPSLLCKVLNFPMHTPGEC